MIGCSNAASDQGNAASDPGDAASQNASGGAGSGAAGAPAGSSSATSEFVLPESCAALGFDIQQGCDGCPVDPPVCECLQGAPLVPEHRCTYGKCLTGFDCDRLCQNLNGPDSNQDLMAIRDCLHVFDACNDDVDCGTGNRCVYSNSRFPPERQCTAPGFFCNENTDCLEGSRCVIARVEDVKAVSNPSSHDWNLAHSSFWHNRSPSRTLSDICRMCTCAPERAAPLEDAFLRVDRRDTRPTPC